MIAVCQPFSSTAKHHALFDSLILRSVCRAFPGLTVAFISDKKTCEDIAWRIRDDSPQNLQFIRSGLPANQARRFHLRTRLAISMAQIRSAARKLHPEAIIYLAFETMTAAMILTLKSVENEYFFVHNNLARGIAPKSSDFSLFSWVMRRANKLIFIEEPILAKASEVWPSHRSKMRVVPHPIDDSEARRPPGDRSGICYAGRLMKGKGIERVVSAANRLLRSDPEIMARLPIFLTGPYINGVRPSDVPGALRFFETSLSDEELDSRLAAAKFAIVPYDPLQYAYITPGLVYRALGCGTPVIASALPSLTGIVNEWQGPIRPFSSERELDAIFASASRMGDTEYEALSLEVQRLRKSRGISETGKKIKHALGI